MKRVFLIHGWEGNPENAWFPWLKKKLEKNGFEVIAPEMPNTEEPNIRAWTSKLKEVVGKVNSETYFIGHSIGCQAIMRYLESLDDEEKVGGVIFVAGWFNLPNLETEEEKEIAEPWLETEIDTEKVKSGIKDGKIVAIFSDDDPDVPLNDKEIFKEKLNAKIIVEHNKGHFNDDADIKELPVVLSEILRISKK